MLTPSPSPSPASASRDRFAAWPRQVQLATMALAGFFVAILLTRGQSYWSTTTRPLQLDNDLPLRFQLDLNEADRATLLQIPGVGEKMADRIITFREANGPFHSLQQLLEIQGIGSATLERLRPWVEVKGEVQPTKASATKKQALIVRVDGPAKPPVSAPANNAPAKSGNLAGPIDINTASLEELQKLPKVGLKRAQQIIDARSKGPFRTLDDLRRIPGFGAKTLESLRPWIMLDKAEQPQTQASSGNAGSGR